MTSFVVISWPIRAGRSSTSPLASVPGCAFAFAFVVGFVCGFVRARIFDFVAWFAPALGFGFAPVRAIVLAGVLAAVVFVKATSATGDLSAGAGATNKRPCSAARV